MRKWIFQPESLTLYNQDAMYEVDLEEMKTSADVLDWILQIANKGGREWDVEGFIGELEYACEKVFRVNAQGVFCPYGVSMKIDWRRKTYGPVET